MSVQTRFARRFEALTGNVPFPWQQALFEHAFSGDFAQIRVCHLPTGLGKTSIIAIWLLALAERLGSETPGTFPRRLVYVVNRRTVVDQASGEVQRWRERVSRAPELADVLHACHKLAVLHGPYPFSVSTLRGQFADNAAWRNDPARPAVVVGTVDMIGSRLLFEGYGCGFRSRPLHAAFLGQDVWLIHDEAHLEPAFQHLVESIQAEQRMSGEYRRFHVSALTATPRASVPAFSLKEADREQKEVRRRLTARKGLLMHQVADKKAVPERVADLALTYHESSQAILVFAATVEDVDRIVKRIEDERLPVQSLTGTLRGFERDRLVSEDPVFARFSSESRAAPASGTAYLVCTSAGEVGINMSGDHMVCDLSTFESMTQRFGRVNRFGTGDAHVDVVVAGLPTDDTATATSTGTISSEDEPLNLDHYERARARTARLLSTLPERSDGRLDVSPAALEALPTPQKLQAYSPEPVIPRVTEELFDAWGSTSIRGALPGRPAVADWLHGIAPWEPPQTLVAWRQEVSVVAGALLERYQPDELLEDYPLKPHELLRDRSDRVLRHLQRIATRMPGNPAWLVTADNRATPTTLDAIAAGGVSLIANCTVLLPPDAGGLAVSTEHGPTGRLDGDASRNTNAPPDWYDVSDDWYDEGASKGRLRTFDEEVAVPGMRLVRSVVIPVSDSGGGEDDGVTERVWRWFVRPRFAEDAGSGAGLWPQPLDEHAASAARYAGRFSRNLGLAAPEATAVCFAARAHDTGKCRAVWQRAIGNGEHPRIVLAKSGSRFSPIELSRYRHELGSIVDVLEVPAFQALSHDIQELVLHLIAAHHGRARPCFSADEVHDPERPDDAVKRIASDVPTRFGRLQRKYGRWGLAYLESLVRAADVLASQEPDPRRVAPTAEGSRLTEDGW